MIITRLPSSIKEKVEAYLNLKTCKNKYTYVHQRYCRSRSSETPIHLHQSVHRLPSPTVHLVISSQFTNRFPYVHHNSPLCTNTIHENIHKITAFTVPKSICNLPIGKLLSVILHLQYTSQKYLRQVVFYKSGLP